LEDILSLKKAAVREELDEAVTDTHQLRPVDVSK
jgi:hypothetical protein